MTATAIVRRHPTNPDTYTQYDALIPPISPDPWTPAHLTENLAHLPPESTYQGGLKARAVGESDTARVWWAETVAMADDAFLPAALLYLALMEREAGDLVAARGLHEQVVESGHLIAAPRAMLGLALVEMDAGDLEGARGWWLKAVESKHPDIASWAMNNLGKAELKAGNAVAARSWFLRSVESKHPEGAPEAMISLGFLEREAEEDLGAARSWFARAARSVIASPNDCPPAAAAFILGLFDWDAGDLGSARSPWVRAAESEHPVWSPRAMELLAAVGGAPGSE